MMQKILIIEDDVDLAQWMVDYLKPHDYETNVVHDGANAIDAIKTFLPDIVILEVSERNFDVLLKKIRLTK